MLLTINERIVDENHSQLSLLDRGFLLGDALFETLRIYGGQPFRLREHLERMSEGAKRLEIPILCDLEHLVNREAARALASGLPNAYLRITLTRGSGLGLDAQPEASTLSTIIAPLLEVAESSYTSGIKVVTARGRRNEFTLSAGIKSSAYLESILELRLAKASGAADALYLDTAGHVSEATASNVFVVAGGVLSTPPIECAALPGITRRTVMELAAAKGIRVSANDPIHAEALEGASEVFLTSSVRELVPVVAIDGRPVGAGYSGEITSMLMHAYSEAVRWNSLR